MAERLPTCDPALALVDNEETAAFMADAFETGDAGYIAHAFRCASIGWSTAITGSIAS
jgi:DNA-binding phage protein